MEKEVRHAQRHHPEHTNPAVLLHLLLAVHLLVVDSVAVLEAAASEVEVVLAVDHAEVASAVAAAEALVEDVAN